MSDYYVKHLTTPLPLADASAIVDHAIRLGKEHGLLPLTIAVLDAGGYLIAFKHEDASGLMKSDIATGKAWVALGMGISSCTIPATAWPPSPPSKQSTRPATTRNRKSRPTISRTRGSRSDHDFSDTPLEIRKPCEPDLMFKRKSTFTRPNETTCGSFWA